MAADDTTTAPAWTVTGQQETADIGPDGIYVPGVRVSFRMASGQSGQVFVPNAAYTPDNVRQAIQDRADTLAAVAALQG